MTEDMKSGSSPSSSTNSTIPSNCRVLAMNEAAGTMQPHSATETIQPPLPPTTGGSSSSVPPVARCRLNPKDFANSDFVNRLVAATRITDFYSANIAPHSFFYSEMLRSLVQARNESESQQAAAVAAASYNSSLNYPLNPLQQQRRNRKRSWPAAHRIGGGGDLRSPAAAGAPACLPGHPFSVGNLTNDSKVVEKIRKKEEKETTTAAAAALGYPEIAGGDPAEKSFPEEQEIKGKSLQVEKPPQPQSSSLVIPTTQQQQQPGWYPPSLYPYGIDPLHFFIDLRVSGQIYDNNNEAKTKTNLPLTSNGAAGGLDTTSKVRHGSAFSVPPSSSSLARNLGTLMAPMNLTTGQSEDLFLSDKRQTLFKDRYLDNNNNHQPDEYHQQQGESKQRGKFSGGEEVIAVVDDDNDSH